MIEKFSISRDESFFHGWPDLALFHDRLVCVFSECTHHGDRTHTRIMVVTSDDRGRTWTAKGPVSEALRKAHPEAAYWNCPRITALPDGRLVVLVDQIEGTREGGGGTRQTNWFFTSHDGGETWSGPVITPLVGIVPDKLIVLKHGPHAGRWLLSAHRYEPHGDGQNWMQRLWFSDDAGSSWQGPVTIAESVTLKLCEGSILELPTGVLVCFLRENSFAGLDGYKAISSDGGLTWHGVYAMPMPGCHRPVAGLLQSGNVLITHRYLQGGKAGWGRQTQNTFAVLTDAESCLATARNEVTARILPLDHDRSPVADTGYTGWVQFPDGEIYVVNYIMDDAPLAQIRGYSLRETDIVC